MFPTLNSSNASKLDQNSTLMNQHNYSIRAGNSFSSLDLQNYSRISSLPPSSTSLLDLSAMWVQWKSILTNQISIELLTGKTFVVWWISHSILHSQPRPINLITIIWLSIDIGIELFRLYCFFSRCENIIYRIPKMFQLLDNGSTTHVTLECVQRNYFTLVHNYFSKHNWLNRNSVHGTTRAFSGFAKVGNPLGFL